MVVLGRAIRDYIMAALSHQTFDRAAPGPDTTEGAIDLVYALPYSHRSARPRGR